MNGSPASSHGQVAVATRSESAGDAIAVVGGSLDLQLRQVGEDVASVPGYVGYEVALGNRAGGIDEIGDPLRIVCIRTIGRAYNLVRSTNAAVDVGQ